MRSRVCGSRGAPPGKLPEEMSLRKPLRADHTPLQGQSPLHQAASFPATNADLQLQLCILSGQGLPCHPPQPTLGPWTLGVCPTGLLLPRAGPDTRLPPVPPAWPAPGCSLAPCLASCMPPGCILSPAASPSQKAGRLPALLPRVSGRHGGMPLGSEVQVLLLPARALRPCALRSLVLGQRSRGD